MASVTVSLKADQKYKNALILTAIQHGCDVGDITKQALDEKFGDEIKRNLSLLASGGVSKHHLDTERAKS